MATDKQRLCFDGDHRTIGSGQYKVTGQSVVLVVVQVAGSASVHAQHFEVVEWHAKWVVQEESRHHESDDKGCCVAPGTKKENVEPC